MSWTDSLIKLSSYEVEVLQKRLAEIAERRVQAEGRLAALAAEGEAETRRAREDAQAGWYLVGYQQGLRTRMEAVQAEIEAIGFEEAGARDALAEAFEGQKKYEQVAENHKQARMREAARRESAMLDELGLRRAAGGA